MKDRLYKIVKIFFYFGIIFNLVSFLSGCHSNTDSKSHSEAIRYDSLAQHEDSLGNYNVAGYYYQKALTLYLNISDNKSAANSLANLGFVYTKKNLFDSAIIYHHRSLEIEKSLQDTFQMAFCFNNLGEIYQRKNQYTQSNLYLDSCLALLDIIRDRVDLVNPITTKGLNYCYLGQFDEALEFHSQAINLWGEFTDSTILSAVLMNLGYDYFNLADYDSALNLLGRALNVARQLEYDEYIGTAQGLISLVLNSQRKYPEALKYADSALSISIRTGQKLDEGAAYYKLGMIHLNAGKPEKAIDNLNKAAYLFRNIGTTEREGMVYYQMMRAFDKSLKPSTAIVYGKNAVNNLQAIRTSIKSLDNDVQRDYLRSKESVYRELADLLTKQERLPEAQQIMNMLKEEEYFDYIRGEAQDTSALNLRAMFAQIEADRSLNVSNLLDSLASYSLEYYALRSRPGTINDTQNRRYLFLNNRIKQVNNDYNKFLDELENKLSSLPEQFAKLANLRQTESLVDVLRKLGPRTVAFYTILEESKLHIILMTSEVNKWKSISFNSNQLNNEIDVFVSLLRDRDKDPLPMAKKMYDLILRPFEQDLIRMNVNEILWSLDGKLRYIPVTALHNGKNFIVENYRNIMIIPRNVSWLLEKEQSKWEILGFGVSKQHGEFRPLPSVIDELNGIVRTKDGGSGKGFIPGVIKLDDQFTLNSMLSDLRNPLPVVHIASHFKLSPGDFSNSFLLLGDGSILTMQELNNQTKIFSGVDLLTLSACNTAMGTSANGGEVESFATLTQHQGAKVILATLWPVQDNSTAELMKHFYRFKYENNTISIAEALQKAQLFLLHGDESSVKTIAQRGSSDDQSNGSKESVNQKFSHPYYWAPFILIGNWK
jgi:CHAT domain-containing protein/tetratricopeptide (TPR) repeat protein